MPITHFDTPADFDMTVFIRLMAILLQNGAKIIKPPDGDEYVIIIGGIVLALTYRCSVLALSADGLIDVNNLSPSMKKKQNHEYEVFKTMSESIKELLDKCDAEEMKSLLDEISADSSANSSSSDASATK